MIRFRLFGLKRPVEQVQTFVPLYNKHFINTTSSECPLCKSTLNVDGHICSYVPDGLVIMYM